MVKAAALSVLLLLSVAALAAAAGGSTNRGGTKCTSPVVKCAANPCRVTTCKAPAKWKCEPNYCGGCKTDWRHQATGLLLVNTCPPRICPQVFAPVCGVNGKTYSNECKATASGIRVRSKGQCPCPMTNKPVCGADGATYRSECLALRSGTTVKYPGTCAFPTACAEENKLYKPVCGNGNTWANACVAKLNGISDYTQGPCNGGICAGCAGPDIGCDAPHRCKGNPRYTCAISDCQREQVLDNGQRVSYALCTPIYSDKDTGFPAAACYP